MSSKLSSALVEGHEEGCVATEAVKPSPTRFGAVVVPPAMRVSTDRKALQQENARLLAENAQLKTALGEKNVKYPAPRRRHGKAPTCAALRRLNDALREENASLADEILADERDAQLVASIDEIVSDLHMMRARYEQRERVVRFGTLCRKLSAVARGAVGRVFNKGPYLPAMNVLAASGRLALLMRRRFWRWSRSSSLSFGRSGIRSRSRSGKTHKRQTSFIPINPIDFFESRYLLLRSLLLRRLARSKEEVLLKRNTNEAISCC
jgi:hypothetical protein